MYFREDTYKGRGEGRGKRRESGKEEKGMGGEGSMNMAVEEGVGTGKVRRVACAGRPGTSFSITGCKAK